MSKIAFVFPGQGSHVVGMGKDIYDAFPVARAVFDQADEVLGFPLSALCFEGPEETLRDTINQQPALLAASIALWRALESSGATLAPSFVAGHSLGEYSALVAAGALDFGEAIALVRERGRVMKEAGVAHPGAMAAVIGMDDAALEAVCREASARHDSPGVVCANYNSPGQVVISGDVAVMESAAALAKERGARRVIPLAVSIASHSPLMKEAAHEFATAVARATIHAPRVKIIANVTAKPLTSVKAIREEMVTQLTSPVRWTASVQYMAAHGVTSLVEVGPKDVLSGLAKRIDASLTASSVADATGVARYAAGGPNA